MTNSSTIVQRVWNYCNVLRDDGISHGDYLEKLTYLLFLKMDDEDRTLGAVLPQAFNDQATAWVIFPLYVCARPSPV